MAFFSLWLYLKKDSTDMIHNEQAGRKKAGSLNLEVSCVSLQEAVS